MLVVDSDATAPLHATVVVVGGELLQVGTEDRLLDPPVEPDQLWLIFVNQLTGTRQPVIEEYFVWCKRFGLSRTIQVRITGILHVGVKLHAAVEEPPVFGPVTREA